MGSVFALSQVLVGSSFKYSSILHSDKYIGSLYCFERSRIHKRFFRWFLATCYVETWPWLGHRWLSVELRICCQVVEKR